FLVGGIFPYRRKLEDTIAPTQAGRPFEDDMRGNLAVVTDLHIRPDNTPRTNADIGTDPGVGSNPCRRVNERGVTAHANVPFNRAGRRRYSSLRSAHRMVASHASSPST